ncbi:MAG: hypothetical protein IPL70_09440 [Uliginosibacterium sp.]|nr:hypothetical protein [Uliginosibacterium sp.]
MAQSTQVQSYQWQRDGVDIPGATTARYAVRASEALNGANFSVVVRSALGQTSSRAARLTVKTQPGISVVAGQLGGPGFADGIGEQARLGGGPIAMGPGNKVYELSQYGLLAVAQDGTVTTLAWHERTDVWKYRLVSLAIDSQGKAIMVKCRSRDAFVCYPFMTEWTAEGGERSFKDPCVESGIRLGTDRFGKVFLACNATVYQIQPSGQTVVYAKPEGLEPTASALFTVGDNGEVYFLEANAVRAVSPTGIQRLIAGQPGSEGVVDGEGAAARFSSVTHIQPGPYGGLYVVDAGQIRQISASGEVKTWALDATVLGALIDGMTVDAAGNVYLDVAGTLRKIPPQSSATRLDQIPVMAGKQTMKGAVNGPAELASFSFSDGLTTFTRDREGNNYVVDSGNHVIRKIDAAGVVSTLAGKAGAPGQIDGAVETARFDFKSTTPQYMTTDGLGNIYVGLSRSGEITLKKITPEGRVSSPLNGVHIPTMAADSKGNLYFSGWDKLKGKDITRMDREGKVTTYAEDSVSENASISALFMDEKDNLYVSYWFSTETRDRGIGLSRVTYDGNKPHVARLMQKTRPPENFIALAHFIVGLAVDSAENVYLRELYRGCSTIEKLTGSSSTVTIAGDCATSGTKPGALPGSLSNDTIGLAVDVDGALYTLSENALVKIVPNP